MMGLLREILLSPFGSFASVFALFALAFYLVYYITKKVTLIDASHEGTNCSVKKIDGHIDEIRKDLAYLKGTINVLKGGLSPIAQSHSPVSLTDLGNQIAIELKAEEMIVNNWEKIYTDLEKNICDKNPYDVQQYCIETASVELEKFLSKDDLNILKKYAFEKGNPLQYYTPIYALIIRDKYFTIKGINIQEIDDFDPIKKS